jgi:hypothetical protein
MSGILIYRLFATIVFPSSQSFFEKVERKKIIEKEAPFGRFEDNKVCIRHNTILPLLNLFYEKVERQKIIEKEAPFGRFLVCIRHRIYLLPFSQMHFQEYLKPFIFAIKNTILHLLDLFFRKG